MYSFDYVILILKGIKYREVIKKYLWNIECHILMKGQRFIYQLLGYKQIDTTLQYIMVKQSNVKEVYRLG